MSQPQVESYSQWNTKTRLETDKVVAQLSGIEDMDGIPSQGLIPELEQKLTATQKSAMLIAYERALESAKPEGERLFYDPYASKLHGVAGELMSKGLRDIGPMVGAPGWPEFTATQSAVRTRFIDDWMESKLKPDSGMTQWVNLGAGMDTRPHRLPCVKGTVCYEVDFQALHEVKAQLLPATKAYCGIARVFADVNFGNQLVKGLKDASFDETRPSLWLMEGLIPYLDGTDARRGLLQTMDQLSAPNSVCNVMTVDHVFLKDGKNVFEAMYTATKDLLEWMEELGWEAEKKGIRFGDPEMNYGRFPTERFEPSGAVTISTFRKR